MSMTPDKSKQGIEEILKVIETSTVARRCRASYRTVEDMHDNYPRESEELVLAIKEYYLGLLPKIKILKETDTILETHINIGRNTAIQEMREKIK